MNQDSQFTADSTGELSAVLIPFAVIAGALTILVGLIVKAVAYHFRYSFITRTQHVTLIWYEFAFLEHEVVLKYLPTQLHYHGWDRQRHQQEIESRRRDLINAQAMCIAAEIHPARMALCSRLPDES